MAFLVIGSLVVTTLANWATNNLGGTAHFRFARNLTYASDGAVNVAITGTRYWYPPSNSLGWNSTQTVWEGPCPQGNPVLISGQTMATWCVMQISYVFSRVVTIEALQDVGGSAIPSASYGSSPPNWPVIVTAQVGFMDNQASSPYLCSPSDCGESMTIVSWNSQ